MPATNADFWLKKFKRNQARDAIAAEALTKMGWRVMVIWECQTRREDQIREILACAFSNEKLCL
jgi:DNA mismatch endonuclease (patch repair protein)